MSNFYPTKRKAPETHTTEFDILKASHKFLRSEEDDTVKSWDAQLAKKYEDSLFKEYGVCDLKHYKTGKIALRWRTEDEVLSGAGEETCGNTRCPYHDAPREPSSSRSQESHLRPPRPPKLTTMELPFSYVERGETDPRQVMVKVVLCERCVKKLMWKREKEKKDRRSAGLEHKRTSPEGMAEKSRAIIAEAEENVKHTDKDREGHHVRSSRQNNDDARSRSKSPRRHLERKEAGRGR